MYVVIFEKKCLFAEIFKIFFLKTSYLFPFLCVLLFFVSSCKKNEKEYVTPVIYTLQPAEITTSKATLRASFLKGTTAIKSYGFEWKKTTDVVYSKTTVQTHTENNFSFLVKNLEKETEYHVKSYIIDKHDTVWYGKELRFFTKGTLTDIDGNTYLTLRYGDFIWMTDNLRVTRFADGTPLQSHTVGKPELFIPLYFRDKWHTPNLVPNQPNFGLLYNDVAVSRNRKTIHTATGFQTVCQGVCPDGWHVSTSTEWMNLLRQFGDTYAELKTLNWGELYHNANNLSSFSLEPAGYFEWRILPNNSETSFEGVFESSKVWGGPYILKAELGAQYVGFSPYSGFSVRCVKDFIRNDYSLYTTTAKTSSTTFSIR